MDTSLLIMEFLPLILYIGIDAWKGYRAGILAAIGATVLMAVFDYSRSGEIDKFVLGEGVMIVIMGFVSLKMNNDRFFKFQPTVLAVIFAGVFAWFQVFDQPLMLKFIPHLEKIFSSQSMALQSKDLEQTKSREDPNPDVSVLSILHTDTFQRVLSRLSGQLIWIFLGHGLIMAYAAMYLTTRHWFAWRLAIYPAMLLLVVINQIFA